MRHDRWIAGLILGCAALCEAGAQSAPPFQNDKSDWTVVERLPVGLPISVHVGRHWRHCGFDWADDESMQCSIDPPPRILAGVLVPAPYIFRREQVRKIRIERADLSTMAGASIGAGAGALPGAVRQVPGTTASGAALEDGLVFGVVGGAIGRLVPLVHGKTIYERAGP